MTISLLVVEDNINVRKPLTRALTKAGYKVFEAANGREALNLLNQVEIDLITLDMQMPDINGLQFLDILKKGLNTIPVIIVSASVYDLPLVYPVKAIIEKPFTLAQILLVIEQVINSASV